MNEKGSPPYIAMAAVLLAAITTVILFMRSPEPPSTPVELQSVLWPRAKSLQAFHLSDHHNQPFDLQRLSGKWTLLFFGYISCPDICPATMNVLSGVFKRLAQDPSVAAQTQVVFVSVDPQRDSLDQLAGYMAYFNKEFLGVTGTAEEIDNLARQVGAAYMQEPADAAGNYLVGHSGSVYLVDPEGAVRGAFPPPHDPQTIAEQYRQIRDL